MLMWYLLFLTILVNTITASASAVGTSTNTSAIASLIDRVLYSGASKQFVLSIDTNLTSCDSPVNECVVLSNLPNHKVGIKGTSLPSLGFGVGTYLRTSCNASLTWFKTGGHLTRCFSSSKTGNTNTNSTTNTNFPPVPSSTANQIFARTFRWTYYQNVCDSSYSFVWWNETRWRQEIDWMSMIGINIALVYTGQEKILRDVYKQFGIDLTNPFKIDIDGEYDYFDGPAFLTWSRGQNQASQGGLDIFNNVSSGGALPSWWYEQQASLGRTQAAYMRELGMTTILRGFENNVPGQLKELYPTANISKQNGLPAAWALDALDPLFEKLSDAYMKALINEFGTDHYYQADGYFSAAASPWMETEMKREMKREMKANDNNDSNVLKSDLSIDRLPKTTFPTCRFSDAFNDTYVGNCPNTLSGLNCKIYDTLLAAKKGCSEIYDCGGITYEYSEYTLRRNNFTTPSPPSNMSTSSWLLLNSQECLPPVPPPQDFQAYKSAAAHSAAAFAGLTRTDPEAHWVYQTWIWRAWVSDQTKKPTLKGWLSSIPKGRGLMLDQTADWIPIWKAPVMNSVAGDPWSFEGQPFIWCALNNFGGNAGMFGSVDTLNHGPFDALAQHTSISGVGVDPEGINQNPAYYSFLLESAWRSTPISNVSTWLSDWGIRRCGRESAKVRKAWEILSMTVYVDSNLTHFEHHTSYCPSTMPYGSGFDQPRGSERPKYYSPDTLYEAWGLLIDAVNNGECAAADGSSSSSSSSSNPAMAFDIVDVGREWLSIAACNDAYDALMSATDVSSVIQANQTMSTILGDIDELLGSSFGFLLGPWIQDARKMAEDAGAPEEGDFMEWNARAQVTSWLPQNNCTTPIPSLPPLWDYANKAWSGLVKGYYNKRYEIFAKHKLNSIANGTTSGLTPTELTNYYIDINHLVCEFGHITDAKLPVESTGNAVDIALRLYQKYNVTQVVASVAH